tara:strand:- start:305 stop:1558 length:1254 start_codon:yes stop_codon:yes gene_type:complete
MLTGGKADPDLQPKARAAKKKKKAAKKSEQFSSVQEWFESNQTRASYQLKHGDDWWWKLNEVHDKMLEKTGECCDDCSEELDEVSMSKALDIDPKDVDRMKTLAVLYTRAMKLPAGSPKQDKFKKEIEKLRKELRMDESVFQELVKSIELGEQPEHEITVGNYTTKFFYMCGSAQKVMKANANVEGAEELTRMQDNFYKLEKEAMDAGEASEEQKKQAVDLYNKIMKKAGEIGLADDIDDYMKMHIDSVIKGKPKLGFGRTDIKESLWANIHKKRQRIKRGSGERMRKKGEKGAPTPAQMKRAKGENTLLKFNQVELKNVWGEVTEAAEYQGRKVQLNNPTRGDVKKFKVYVKNDKGNVVKVEFGDPNMEIKRDDPARRKNFRARHNCDNPGPKYKARYWSCKFWEKGKSVTDLMKG